MNDRALLRTGIIGSVIATVCCGTPVLALALGALGVSAWLAWTDYVVLPALIAFLALTGHAFYRTRQRNR